MKFQKLQDRIFCSFRNCRVGIFEFSEIAGWELLKVSELAGWEYLKTFVEIVRVENLEVVRSRNFRIEIMHSTTRNFLERTEGSLDEKRTEGCHPCIEKLNIF